MSLENIFRVVSQALKSASELNSGTAEEKAAVEVLGGLSTLLEARVQLHKRASPAAVGSTPPAPAAARPVAGLPRPEAAKPPVVTTSQAPKTADAGDSYDLK